MYQTHSKLSNDCFCGIDPTVYQHSSPFRRLNSKVSFQWCQDAALTFFLKKTLWQFTPPSNRYPILKMKSTKFHQINSMNIKDPMHHTQCFESRESNFGPKFSQRLKELNNVSNSTFFASTSVASPPPPLPPSSHQMALIDRALLFLGFIACAVTGALAVLIFTAIPTLIAMRKAAIELEKLAESVRSELPATMAAIRLSGMEISDLTMELSDLSQEISEGVKSSARAVQAAEEGLKKMSNFASSRTISMLQERASVPVEAVKPAVAQAAKKTKIAVQKVRKVVKQISTVHNVSGWITSELKRRAELNPMNLQPSKQKENRVNDETSEHNIS